MRAMHQDLDAMPILNDAIAGRLVDPQLYEMTRKVLTQMPPVFATRTRAMFATRSRYAEDCVAAACRNGIRQYVILGAGFDTFAYRQPPWAAELGIFEVDYPSTQELKRSRLAAAGIEVPPNAKFAAVDFETLSLRDGLSRAGFNFSRPAIFSMLGVSQYLSEEALDMTLSFVLSMRAASEIIFTFVLPDAELPADEVPLIAMSAQSAAAQGEPWIARFPPEELRAKLLAMGFATAHYFSPDDANRRYFNSRSDGVTTFAAEQSMRATV